MPAVDATRSVVLMLGRSRLATVTALCLLASVDAGVSAASARTIWGFHDELTPVAWIGPWEIYHRGTRTLAEAERVFGRPDGVVAYRRSGGRRSTCVSIIEQRPVVGETNVPDCFCTVQWRSPSVTAVFGYRIHKARDRRLHATCNTGAGRLRYAEVTGPGWRTIRDLRVGDSVARIRQRFPCARRIRPDKWSLSYSSAVIHERYSGHFGVEVEAVRGRVTLFRVAYSRGRKLYCRT